MSNNTYPDNIYYDTLTLEQNDYLFNLREDYRNNGGFTGEEKDYLKSLEFLLTLRKAVDKYVASVNNFTVTLK